MGVVEVGVVAAEIQLDVKEVAVHCLECFACCAQIHLHAHAPIAAECCWQPCTRHHYTCSISVHLTLLHMLDVDALVITIHA